MIRYLIDANAAVCSMDVGHESLKARIADGYPGEIAISTITFAEIAHGTHGGKRPPPEVLDAFVAAIPLAPFDAAAARTHARLPSTRARFNRLLAAQALCLGAVVVTNNQTEFADVPGLVVENWTL